MSRDDPTDGAIRQGEPPHRLGSGPKAASIDKLASTAAVHPVMVILVWSLRVAAVLIAGWAGLGAFFAMMFRFDTLEEFEMAKRFDVEVGGALALAVVLFFVPSRIKKPLQCVLILGIAALVWLFVSWNLLAHHEWVHRIRSGL
jgi:hypothetical protein